MGPVQRRMNELHLVDSVGMARNALEAVRCLAMPTIGTGNTTSGAPECLELVGRNHFVDLLEIISDRLSLALENEANRATH